MAFRFFRRIRIAPGITLNLSKSGGSISLGGRGARYTIGPRGTRRTVGIPGTGLFYTTTSSFSEARGKRRSSLESEPAAPQVSAEQKLSMGFFKRLVTPKVEEAFVDACRDLVRGREDAARKRLRGSSHPDCAFLAGMLSLKKGRFADAAGALTVALAGQKELGRLFAKYSISADATIAITEEITAHLGANTRGVLLGLVEAYQRQNQWQRAIECLRRLRRLEPDDPLVKLSLAELLMDAAPEERKTARYVVELAGAVDNESGVHAALLLYKAKALRVLGLHDAARDVLSAALRRKKDRPAELLRALRYERALAYDSLGQARRARAELERLYADAPDYEDVASRLGVGPVTPRPARRGD